MLSNNIIRQFFVQILGLVSGFIISILTARILGAGGRGDFALLLNTSQFLVLLLGLSLSPAIVHVISTNRAPLRETINSISFITIVLVLGCLGTLLFFPFDKFNFLLPEGRNLFYTKAVLLAIFITSTTSILINSILSGKKLFREQQKLSFLYIPVSLAIYIALYLWQTKLSLRAFIIYYVAINFLQVLASFYLYVRYARPPFQFKFLDSTQLKYILTYSFTAYIANLFQFMSYRMDFWFVKHYSGSEQLGIYSLAVSLAQMLWLLPQAIASIFVAYSGSGNHDTIVNQTNALTRTAFSVLLVVGAILYFAIEFMIPLFYGHEFLDSIVLFKMLLAGVIPFSITTVIASYFVGKGKVRINMVGGIIGFIFCLCFDIILIPLYGNQGAAIATIISYCVSTVYTVFVYIKASHSSLKQLFIINRNDIVFLRAKLRDIMLN